MALFDVVAGLLDFAQRQLDRAISTETRRRVYDRVQAFAAARPLLFTFIVAQVLTSLLPVALFMAFTTSVLFLSVGVALLFSLFWFGVALLFLIPALFVTVSLGFIVFTWALAARFAWAALPAGLKAALLRRRPNPNGVKGPREDTNRSHNPAEQALKPFHPSEDADTKEDGFRGPVHKME